MRLRCTQLTASSIAVAALLFGSAAAADDSPTPPAAEPGGEPAGQAQSPEPPPPSGPGTVSGDGTAGAGDAVSAPGSTTATSTASTSPQTSPDEDTAQNNLTLQRLGLGQKKWWNVGAIFETHRLIRQEDLNGAARDKALNYLYYYGSVMPTQKDQIQVRGGIYQRFLADDTETGVRADDVVLAYTRTVPLPYDFTFRPTASNAFPISFASRNMGLVSTPRATLSLMRNFLDGSLNVNLRPTAAYYITTHRQATGGGTIPYASTGIGLDVNYSMPFHPPLQVGASVQTYYYFNHETEHANDPTLQSQFQNTPIQPTRDPQFESQPVSQTYGGEVYVGYQLPKLLKASSNIQLALAQGDTTLGYAGVIHDGRSNVYWMFRRSAQVYLALQVQY